MTTRNLGLVLMTESQQNKYITHNTALHAIDSWIGGVKSRATFAPTLSPQPSAGDAYIVNSVSGAWSTFTEGDIATYYLDSSGTAAWNAVSPNAGPLVYVEDEDVYVRWSGTVWETVGAVATISELGAASPVTYTLQLTDANSVIRVTAARTIVVPKNSAVDFPIGTEIIIRRAGTDAVTITPDGSPQVVLNGSVTLTSQHDEILLRYVAEDEWDAS